MTAASDRRRINVGRLEVEKTGTKNDKPWTLYIVHATNPDGTPIQGTLKTFDALTPGEQDMLFLPYEKDGVFQHWTLKRPQRPKAKRRDGGAPVPAPAPTPEWDASMPPTEQLAALARRQDRLERKLDAIIRAEGVEVE